MSKILCLDYSTTSTGFALFEIETKQLIDFGILQPNKKVSRGKNYPAKQLLLMQDLAEKINSLVESITDLKSILIEEICQGISRIGQKTLCGGHFILLASLSSENLNKVHFRDADGPNGWRTRLGLKLNESDKEVNKLHKALNKKKKKGTADLIVINKKHLAARYVNGKLGTSFDVEMNATDNDVVDAIGIGLAEFLTLE